MINGIDVSKHNGVIDWAKVAADGIKVAIIRAGYGQFQIDDKFSANITGALRNGIDVGIYWFIYASNVDEAIRNARKCDETIKMYKSSIKYRVWADWEYDSDKRSPGQTKASRTNIVKAFCDELTRLGYSVGVYANPDYLKSKFNDLSFYPLWLAQYASKPATQWKFEIWQKSSSGHVNGINGNVDLDEFYTNSTSASAPHIASRRTLKKGMSGSDVIVLQKRLAELGYYSGKIDGIYGNGTAKAVLCLQYDRFVDKQSEWDAKCGPKTWALIE